MSIADLEDNYGENWEIREHPLTGKTDIGEGAYFSEVEKLTGDDESAGYLPAMNEPNNLGSQKDADKINKELAESESKYRMSWSPEYEYWVAAKDGEEKPRPEARTKERKKDEPEPFRRRGKLNRYYLASSDPNPDKASGYLDTEEIDKRFVEERGTFRVYLVSGLAVRKLNMGPFVDSGTHADIPKLIPEGELWIDDGLSEEGRRLVIDKAWPRRRAAAEFWKGR